MTAQTPFHRFGWLLLVFSLVSASSAEEPQRRVYENRLVPLADPRPILADHPEFVAPVRELNRFESPSLVDDTGADLEVRAWRFSYNARGIIEMPNHLRARETALIMVHPWAIDDGQGWKTPEPNGVCDFCTPAKNALAARHTRTVVNPFLQSLRGKLALVMYSLPGPGDAIRKKVYRTFEHTPGIDERKQGELELKEALARPPYRGEPLPAQLTLTTGTPVVDYFRSFPGLDAGLRYNGPGFWTVPIPVTRDVDVDPADVLIFDGEGYPPLRDFLKRSGIRHVLLTGYATDMCFCRTTAGYENLSKDFNVFLVGDATLATFPASDTPCYATTASLSFASLNQLVTQISWIQYTGTATKVAR
jgi:nicotinamidase-related amidase